MRRACCGILLSIIATSAVAGDGETPQSRFPFPVAIDEEKGRVDGLPIRVRDTDTGSWYVLVPNGTYQIGSDMLTDSRAISVTMSGFYFSEEEVDCSQIAQFLEIALHDAVGQEGFVKEEPGEPSDGALALRAIHIHLMLLGWRHALAFDSDFTNLLGAFVSSIAHRAEVEADEADQARFFLSLQLADRERQVAKQAHDAFQHALSELRSRGEETFELAHYLNASDYAEWRGVDLPTEAQWEVAARFDASVESIALLGQMDDVLEWCSDYYAFDYFDRQDDFDDPQGPRRGRLSADQVRDETPISGLQVATRFIARSLTVLRGGDVSARSYGRRSSLFVASFGRPKGIRLAFSLRETPPE